MTCSTHIGVSTFVSLNHTERLVVVVVDLKKRATENEREYIWRLASAKEAGEIDLNWTDLTNVLNNELRPDCPYQEAAYRKPYTSAKAYYDDVFAKREPDTFVQSLQDAARNLQIERVKLSTEKLENNRWIREYARDELIAEKIIDAIQNVQPLTPPSPSGYRMDAGNGREAILAFGDEHFGAEFEIKGLRGEIINAYSPEIFESRMQDLLDQTIAIVLKENISLLNVYELGDFCDGILRVGQLMKLRYGVVDSTIIYANYIADWLNQLSSYVPIRFQMVSGNHSELRLLDSKKGQFERENMTRIVLELICARLAGNDNIEIVQNPTGLIFDSVCGMTVLGVHGEVKNIERALKDFSMAYNVHIDCLLAGHLHHNEQETIGVGIETIRVPSIIGVDSFAMKLNRTSRPGATLFFLENGLGKTQEYAIKL